MGDVGEAQPTIGKVLADLLDADPVEQVAEAGLLFVEAALQRADIGTESIRHSADGSAAPVRGPGATRYAGCGAAASDLRKRFRSWTVSNVRPNSDERLCRIIAMTRCSHG